MHQQCRVVYSLYLVAQQVKRFWTLLRVAALGFRGCCFLTHAKLGLLLDV